MFLNATITGMHMTLPEFHWMLVPSGSMNNSSYQHINTTIIPSNHTKITNTTNTQNVDTILNVNNIAIFLCFLLWILAIVLCLIWRFRNHVCIRRMVMPRPSSPSPLPQPIELKQIRVDSVPWHDTERDILPSWYKSREQGVMMHDQNIDLQWTRSFDSKTACRV